jgi:hypothetical protein
MANLKPGTRIEVSGVGLDWKPTWEAATIARRNSDMGLDDLNAMEARRALEGKSSGSWHPVKYADGGVMILHSSGFRVVDNRL